jgi:hypothetical protein
VGVPLAFLVATLNHQLKRKNRIDKDFSVKKKYQQMDRIEM